jgi:ribosomal protein S18 acetylase RimI-like enzyme
MSNILIRRFAAADQLRWCELWAGYNSFYRRTVESRVTERLWLQLLTGKGEPFGFVAQIGQDLVGFTHYFFVPSTSDWGPRFYMQNLYADPEKRGRGVGRALIEALYAEADRYDAAQAYRLTAESNATARRLYDAVATATSFIKYRR